MEDDEGKKDWATREAAKERLKAEQAAKAAERSARDAHLKDIRGKEVFEQLRAWMDGQAKSFSDEIPEQAFKVGEKIEQFGGTCYHHFFTISDPHGGRLPGKISYTPNPPHEIGFECPGVGQKRYFLAARDDGTLFFETPHGESKTTDELGSELLKLWRSQRPF